MTGAASTGDRQPARVVLDFLACGGRRDFSAARDLLEEDVTRTGPDGDVKQGREEYLAYLSSVLAGASDYQYQVRRCAVSEDRLSVLVEIDESLTGATGAQVSVSEAMVFDLAPSGRIAKLSVYMKVPPGTGP